MFRVDETKVKNLSLKGLSSAGTGTCFIVPELKVCMDTAMGLPFSYPMKHYLVTHAHMDHAGGVPYIISQRSLMGLDVAPVYVPEAAYEGLKTIIESWKKLEMFDYEYDLQIAKPGEVYPISREYSFTAFKTVHRVPSQGYTILHNIKKLKPEYRGLDGDKIKGLKDQGVDIEEHQQRPILSFTGDTEIEFLDVSPEVANTEYLLMECTYFDESRPVERAKKWGHIHFDEVIQALPKIKSKKILLTHNSTKYTYKAIQKILDERLPEHEKSRVQLFPNC